MKKEKVWKWVVILFLCFIWIHSLIPADLSGAESTRWAELFNRIFAVLRLPFRFAGDHILRKMAHVSEYALLGIFCTIYFRAAGKLEKSCGSHHLLYTGFTAAFLDETIQLFVQGRSGEIRDVWIDLLGFAAAAGIMTLAGRKKVSEKQ